MHLFRQAKRIKLTALPCTPGKPPRHIPKLQRLARDVVEDISWHLRRQITTHFHCLAIYPPDIDINQANNITWRFKHDPRGFALADVHYANHFHARVVPSSVTYARFKSLKFNNPHGPRRVKIAIMISDYSPESAILTLTYDIDAAPGSVVDVMCKPEGSFQAQLIRNDTSIYIYILPAGGLVHFERQTLDDCITLADLLENSPDS